RAGDPGDHADRDAEQAAACCDQECLGGGNATAGMAGRPDRGERRHVVLGLRERESAVEMSEAISTSSRATEKVALVPAG
ncbi:MAG: hypothetical protein ABI934_12035, partial [Actinomycetota bacterium]